MLKGILFDLDRCVFDTRTVSSSCFEPVLHVLHKSHLQQQTKEEVAQLLWSRSFDDILESISIPPDIAEKIREVFRKLEVTGDVATFGDEKIIQTLPGIKIVVTTGYAKFQESKILKTGIRYLFDEIIIDARDNPEARKGKETIFTDVLQKYNWQKNEVVVLGDNPRSELGAAKSLGITTIQTLRPGVVKWSEADHHIYSFFELPDLLKNSYFKF